MKKIALVLVLSSLAACSSFKNEKTVSVFDDTTGPSTKEQMKTLPNTLAGDTENAQHTGKVIVGDNMTDPK